MRHLLAVFFLTSLAFGAEVAGQWTGTIDIADPDSGTTIITQVHIELQRQGESLAGKIGRIEDKEQVAIQNARVDGETLTFEAASEDTAGPMKFSLRLSGDRMEGTMNGSIGNGNITGKVKLTRDK